MHVGLHDVFLVQSGASVLNVCLCLGFSRVSDVFDVHKMSQHMDFPRNHPVPAVGGTLRTAKRGIGKQRLTILNSPAGEQNRAQGSFVLTSSCSGHGFEKNPAKKFGLSRSYIARMNKCA